MKLHKTKDSVVTVSFPVVRTGYCYEMIESGEVAVKVTVFLSPPAVTIIVGPTEIFYNHREKSSEW
jgi:hypothetical protein